jgi:hypothetical protein
MRHLWSLWLVLALAAPAAADDFLGVRPLGTGGAHRAIVNGNDAIELNPAGMSQFQRYSLELQYLLTPKFGASDGEMEHVFHASVVDNQTQPVATGLAYTRVERGGAKAGNRFDLATSYPISENVILGTDIYYINFDRDGKEDAVDAVTVDVGVLVHTAIGLNLAVVGYALTNTGDYLEHPVSMAAGVSYAPFRTLQFGFDFFSNFQRPKDPANPTGEKESGFSYHFGAEYLALGQVTIRAGYTIDQARPGAEEQFWSAGAGWVSETVAVDFGYRGPISHGSWGGTFAFALRLFM